MNSKSLGQELEQEIDCVLETGPSETFTLWSHLQPVGYWVLYPEVLTITKFAMYHKPTPEQIKNTQELLGWGWEDYAPPKEFNLIPSGDMK